MGRIITINDLIYLFRIFLAVLAGAVIGYEREQREKVAGLRTHILISMASAIMMIVSKYAFFDVLVDAAAPGLGVDVSRVAAGIIAGMGIFSGGIVFIGKRGNVSGLTTAAGIWVTIGIGMVIGAGMYVIGIGAVVMVELIQQLLRHDLPIYRHSVKASVNIKLKDPDKDYKRTADRFESYGGRITLIKWEKASNAEVSVRCNVLFDAKYGRDDIIRLLDNMEEVKGFELL